MQITVEVDERIAHEAVKQAWQELFSGGSNYSGFRAMGYTTIRSQLAKIIETMDFSADIRATIAAEMPAIMRDVAGVEIRKRLKETVKEMKAEGTLFE